MIDPVGHHTIRSESPVSTMSLVAVDRRATSAIAPPPDHNFFFPPSVSERRRRNISFLFITSLFSLAVWWFIGSRGIFFYGRWTGREQHTHTHTSIQVSLHRTQLYLRGSFLLLLLPGNFFFLLLLASHQFGCWRTHLSDSFLLPFAMKFLFFFDRHTSLCIYAFLVSGSKTFPACDGLIISQQAWK